MLKGHTTPWHFLSYCIRPIVRSLLLKWIALSMYMAGVWNLLDLWTAFHFFDLPRVRIATGLGLESKKWVGSAELLSREHFHSKRCLNLQAFEMIIKNHYGVDPGIGKGSASLVLAELSHISLNFCVYGWTPGLPVKMWKTALMGYLRVLSCMKLCS